MAMPRYDSKNSRIAIANGRASAEPPSARHSQTATANVTMGTGDRKRMLGQENQRSATVCSISGVHRWTMTIAIRTPRRQSRPLWRAPTRGGAPGLLVIHPPPGSAGAERGGGAGVDVERGGKKKAGAPYGEAGGLRQRVEEA